jgi:hypothetical protein
MPSFAELEKHVDRALADLPPLTAPGTLLPRVLAAVQQWAARPWYQRAWLTWPVGLQVASATLLILLVAGGALAMPLVQAQGARLTAFVSARAPIDVPNLSTSFRVTATALVVAWRALVQPLLLFVLPIAFMAGVAGAAILTALNRVLVERSVPR